MKQPRDKCCDAMAMALPSFKKDFGAALLYDYKTGKSRVVSTLLVNNPDKGPGQKRARQLVLSWCPWCKTPLTDEARMADRAAMRKKGRNL